jgi:4-amino-4-deoxy-L-arabinose transferase-like glycosyltransferase
MTKYITVRNVVKAAPLLGLAGLYLLIQVVFNGVLSGFGIFRDEFYYLVNAERLAWGYVDHPPLAPLLLSGVRTTLGESTLALRLLPALAGAGTVLLAGLTARRMGGTLVAQVITALAVIAVPVYGVMFGFYSMNALEILLWAAAAYVAVMLLTEDQPRLWLLFGLLVGIGLQNKHTFLIFAVGLVLGLLLHRRNAFRNRWIWLGGLVALVILLPNLIWQVQHHWPTLEFYAGAADKNIARSPLDVLLDQLLAMNPGLLAVWLLGLICLLRSRTFRPLAWSYLLPLFLLMVLGSSRPDRLAPAYLPLFAAGAVSIEELARRQMRLRWLPAAAALLVLVSAVAVAPLGLPLLPPQTTARYAEAFGLGSYEEGVTAELPQYFADRFGWQELTTTVAQVYSELSPEEQEQVGIFTSNYGEAGAIHFYGRSYGLPEPISGHNNYWLWGPGNWSGEVLIAVNVPREDLARFYASVEQVASTSCRFCVDYENNTPILVARRPKVTLMEVWPQAKHYE